MSDSSTDGDVSASATEAMILLTGGLPSLKDVASFLKGQGIVAEILRPDDCNINS